MGSKEDKKVINTNLRAPVVTIMGHVDHGKTTLLDYIRKSNIADREFGGITQHVSSYQIEFNKKPITFIDTPGHEAFFAMRERGAKITDIIILVVAADDGVMPQTKEVINVWKKANTHLIVAINKIDMPGANLEKVKRQLSSEGILVEGYGGDIPVVEISAKLGTNVDKLLDLINLYAEIHELDKFTPLTNVNYMSESIVLESSLDKSLGPIATIIVKAGTIKRGDFAVGGKIYGKIRAIINDQGKTIDEAHESLPVKMVGIPKVLEVGEFVRTYVKENDAREASKDSINEIKVEQKEQFSKNMLANMFAMQLEDKEIKKLNIIVIADTNGSLEAIIHSLNKIDIPGTKLDILDARAGNLTYNDINLASTRGGIILAFNVKVDSSLEKSGKDNGVLVREYKIIYELVEDIEGALISLVEPTIEEEVLGEAEVRQVFQLSNDKFVAGCRVTKNKIIKGYNIYVLRKGERIFDSKITSLKHNKDEVKEAGIGTECGILMEPNFEFQTGDTVICYKTKKVQF